jgi:hypothetical protein
MEKYLVRAIGVVTVDFMHQLSDHLLFRPGCELSLERPPHIALRVGIARSGGDQAPIGGGCPEITTEPITDQVSDTVVYRTQGAVVGQERSCKQITGPEVDSYEVIAADEYPVAVIAAKDLRIQELERADRSLEAVA